MTTIQLYLDSAGDQMINGVKIHIEVGDGNTSQCKYGPSPIAAGIKDIATGQICCPACGKPCGFSLGLPNRLLEGGNYSYSSMRTDDQQYRKQIDIPRS